MNTRLLQAFALLVVSSAVAPEPAEASADGGVRIIEGKPYSRTGPVDGEQLRALREEARSMFKHAFDSYMQKAFPMDDLRPISCRGTNSQGGIALTLIDALDTLILLGEQHEVRRAVRWLGKSLSLDVDERVHVFELTIRALGGLLSAHVLLLRNSAVVPRYDGCLLRLAQELGERLLPAFNTPTGVPLSWVNLHSGVIAGDTRITCTACAGTLLLEFGLLSRLSGDPKYEEHARNATLTLYRMRSPRTGLLGNTLNVDRGVWVRTDSGIGAGIDSFYEYLIKAWLVFGDHEFLDMFADVYSSAMGHMRLPEVLHHHWLVDVHMESGRLSKPWISSLGAFWPGMQALFGEVSSAEKLHGNLTAAWRRFGWLPELFDLGLTRRHPVEKGYPLRPELIESTYLLHVETGDPRYVELARDLQATLMDRNKQRCGFASVRDVSSGELEDSMESFFLSETSKYLYLIYSNSTGLLDHFVFSTEGHLLPAMPSDGGGEARPLSPGDVPEACWSLCSRPSERSVEAAERSLARSFPLISVDGSLKVVRPRRCLACVRIAEALEKKKRELELQARAPSSGDADGEGTCDTGEAPPRAAGKTVSDWLSSALNTNSEMRILNQVACLLAWDSDNQMYCSAVEVLEAESGQPVDLLPPNLIVLQLVSFPANSVEVSVQYEPLNGGEPVRATGTSATFGPQFVIGSPGLLTCKPRPRGPEAFLEEHLGSSGQCGAGDEPAADEVLESLEAIQGPVAEVEPREGCRVAQDLTGRVALIDRGDCSFMTKISEAQDAGAIAVIVVNVLSDGEVLAMGDDGSKTRPDVPAVMITKEAGEALRRSIQEAWKGGGDLVVSIAAELQPKPTSLEATQVNLLITPQAQLWLLAKSKQVPNISDALHGILNDPLAYAALFSAPGVLADQDTAQDEGTGSPAAPELDGEPPLSTIDDVAACAGGEPANSKP
uniref:alpha-1,2-Mannosidase n=2 Tax=Tetraselmis sp. GSL018 TaxID=582737 RepID=A0A061R9P2_9CHLO|mmetsp:Transcript_25980/g.61774  ORF Transcript_25980/g.61774 Transcript_25980/m.61774 type:complete len:949 (-) Transcript_25980:419-3265(-)